MGVRALFQLLADQHAVASAAQARRLGVTTRMQQRLVADGVLTCPAPGVLAAAGCTMTFESRAMTATLLPGIVAVSHGAAARLHGLAGFDDHDVVDVIAAKGADPPTVPGMTVRYTRGPVAEHVTVVAGIPALTVAATLVLLAPAVGVVRTAHALEDALTHGLDPTELDDVVAAWRRRGRAGPPTLEVLLRRRAARRSSSTPQPALQSGPARRAVRAVPEHSANPWERLGS